MGDENGETSLEPRTRRSTIERFNDEMAVLDRPLENEGEYFEEEPPRKGRRLGVLACAAFALGAAAFMLWSRVSGAVAATPPLVVASALSVAEPAAAPIVPSAPAPAPAHAPIVQPVPAPSPAPSAPVAVAESAPEQTPPAPMPHASSSAAWTKAVGSKGREAQHHRRGGRRH
jgi:hypothetical protein